MRKFLVIILITAATSGIINAQWSFSLSTDQEYNDNPFRSPIPEEAFISSVDFGVENSLNNFSIGYYGSFINFSSNRDRNFYWHQLAGWKDLENSSYGIFAEQRINRELYNYFDYSNIALFYKIRFNLNNFYFSIAPNLNYTKYNSIGILDNLKGTLAFSVNHGFETKTTVIAGGSFNYKKYSSPTKTETLIYTDENGRQISETITSRNFSNLSQIVSYLRIAQSVTPTTGLAFQFTNRTILSQIPGSLKEVNTIYGDESEIFDDPVNSEGNSASIELTQLITDTFVLKAGYYFNKKFYPTQGIYDATGSYYTEWLRSDEQDIFNLSVSKNFSLNDEETAGLSLGFNYQYLKNNSNSYWFNYKSSSINFQIGLEF